MSNNVQAGPNAPVGPGSPLLANLPNWQVFMTSFQEPDPGPAISDGYFGAAYINTVTGEIVIANRGSVPVNITTDPLNFFKNW